MYTYSAEALRQEVSFTMNVNIPTSLLQTGVSHEKRVLALFERKGLKVVNIPELVRDTK